MTDTANATAAHPISHRAVTRSVQVWANCRGINHSDSGEIVIHDRCGDEVVIREDGRIFNVELSGFHNARKFSCYHGGHVCDPARVAAADARRAKDAADGTVTKGVTVEVFKGRKVAKGTIGVVKWIGDSGFGERVGLAVDGVQGLVYTAITNVRFVSAPQTPAPAVAETPAPVAAPAAPNDLVEALRDTKITLLDLANEALNTLDDEGYAKACDALKHVNAQIKAALANG